MKKITTWIYLFLVGILMLILSNQIVVRQTKSQIYNEISEVPFREYALVPGAAKNGRAGLNPYFKYRLDAAILLYNAGKMNKIIVSGDNHTANYNETRDMYEYLVKHGIPAAAIIMDYAGFRTLDSVIRAKQVFGANELLIVSQEFHNQRALFIANHFNVNAVAFNAMDVNSGKNYTHLREYLAKFLMIFDLYVFQTQPKFPT